MLKLDDVARGFDFDLESREQTSTSVKTIPNFGHHPAFLQTTG